MKAHHIYIDEVIYDEDWTELGDVDFRHGIEIDVEAAR